MSLHRPELVARADPAPTCDGAERRERHVVGDRSNEREALFLAVLAHESHALPDARVGRPVAALPSRDPHRTSGDRVEPVDRAEGLRATGADQAGDAENLAAVEREIDLPRPPVTGERAKFEQRLAAFVGDGGEELVERAADHELDDLLTRDVRHATAADGTTVAEHGVAIGDAVDLFEEVADVGDPHAALAKCLDDAEEPLDVAQCERTRGLVEDDHAGLVDEGARDFDDLLLADAQAPDDRLGVDLRVSEERQRLADAAAVAARVDPTPTVVLPSEEDVGLDAQVRREVELLVDHAHARATGDERTAARKRIAGECDRAGVRTVHAREHLHERALAGAVFADERVDFTRADLEVDVVERDGRPEALRHRRHPEEGVRHRGVLSFPASTRSTPPRLRWPASGAPSSPASPRCPASPPSLRCRPTAGSSPCAGGARPPARSRSPS